jgi:3-phenylpropionate/trans-cinnamate dioxygenase ferredoxin subunit
MAGKHAVCYVDELPTGKRKIVEVEGRSIGVFNVDDRFYAVRNRCPHKGAPLCRGMVKGLVTGEEPGDFEIERAGEILRCPWHGWEFDLTTGGSVFNPHKMRVKSYHVSVEPVEPVIYEFADDPDDDDPSLETFPVSVETADSLGRAMIYVHLGQGARSDS